MKGWLSRFLNPAASVIFVAQSRLPEATVRSALAVAEDEPVWRALHQVIDDMEREANGQARKSVANHGISASCTGGGEWLALLRDRLVSLREAGIHGAK